MDFSLQTTTHNRFRIGHSFLTAGAFIFLIFSLLISTVSTIPAVAFGTETIFQLSNVARQQNNLPTFELSPELSLAAQAKAEHMARNNYFEHTAPDGTTGWDFIANTEYKYQSAGENLAASNQDDSAVVDGWLESPGHRANLLNEDFSDIGLGIAFIDSYLDYEDVYFIVALYGKQTSTGTPTVQGSSETPPLTPPGVASLNNESFTINKNTFYIATTVAGLLMAAGVILEIRRLYSHLHATRLSHQHR